MQFQPISHVAILKLYVLGGILLNVFEGIWIPPPIFPQLRHERLLYSQSTACHILIRGAVGEDIIY